MLYASADYHWTAGSPPASGCVLGERFDDAANLFPLDAYALLDLRAAWPLNEHVELYGRIENAADEAYEQARLYGAPGRGVFVGLRARF